MTFTFIIGTSDAVLSSLSKESWEANTLSFLAKHGESFMDMVCRDACDGPEIGEVIMLEF